MEEKKVSKSVLKRLPGYLAYLKNMPENAPAHISATALANALGMGEVQVRKDLAMVSDGGRPKIGYLRETLIDDIEQFLGYDNTTDAVLIGAGKLGQALMGYSGFDEYGLNILAAFDASPKAEKTEEAPVKTEKSAEEKPKRTYRKPSGEKRPFRKEGDRPYRKNDGEKRPFRKDGEYRPYRKNDGEKRPFRKEGDRPFRKSSTGKPSFNSGKRSFRNKT